MRTRNMLEDIRIKNEHLHILKLTAEKHRKRGKTQLEKTINYLIGIHEVELEALQELKEKIQKR